MLPSMNEIGSLLGEGLNVNTLLAAYVCLLLHKMEKRLSILEALGERFTKNNKKE